eukprot:1075081-Ditylum_brightwellii.AAC.1
MKKYVLASSELKARDYEELRIYLGWMHLETVKLMFDCTTQLAMGSLLKMPFQQHHKSRTPQFNILRLAE